MGANPTINPFLTTNAQGSFGITTEGVIQGTAYNDPSARFALAGGVLASSETLPMWGGVAITENVPGAAGRPRTALGGIIKRATNISTTGAALSVTGFSVFDQAHAMINWPQSPVPQAGPGGQVNFYRFGSGARVAVKCDPGLVAALQDNPITTQVSWDFNDSLLQEYVASGGTESVTSMTWSNTNGGQVAVVMAGASIYKLGDTINVGGVTNTGTGAVGLINTNQVINTWTDSTHFTFLLPGDSTLWGTFGGTIVLNVGTGALPISDLEVIPNNNMTVNYDPVTGFATWNRNDCAAIILL